MGKYLVSYVCRLMMGSYRAIQIRVQGLVQGVGFRPFVYRKAIQFGIKGWVENRNNGVFITAEGNNQQLASFISSIEAEAPLASAVKEVRQQLVPLSGYQDFTIRKSKAVSEQVTEVSPDIAVCEACLADIEKAGNRYQYPFTNCTHCGPRFTIIRDLPYDRMNTTMEVFNMCASCKKEYQDVLDRRFHAQPIACHSCGPQYHSINFGRPSPLDVSELAHDIDQGRIVAIKGLGGFHLACNALDEEAVARLRSMKIREGKPFAVMIADESKIAEYCMVSDEEIHLLRSWRRPIVLLRAKTSLAPSVSMGLHSLGVLMPYMPLHYMLFRKLKTPVIVLTSGNITDDPIITDNQKALEVFSPLLDQVITYNREIHNRTDDSVAMVVNKKIRLIRRSRSYAPEPVDLGIDVDGILAMGAELANTFCLGKGHQAILGQHMGDLKNPETLAFYEESLERYQKLFRFTPGLIVTDLHPDYLSTRKSLDFKLPVVGVQHHHAHIAACMAEHGLDEKILGISFDGTGLGTDGHIWGGEFFLTDLIGFERIAHFEYVPLPGGDLVTHQPWRTALGFLYKYMGNEALKTGLSFMEDFDLHDLELIAKAIDLKLNCPMSCSAGRLFDAVSALIGLGNEMRFHAEAPMRLENEIKYGIKGKYSFDYDCGLISWKKMFYQIVKDLKNGLDRGEIAAKFHNTVVSVIFAVAKHAREKYGMEKVVLSGGSFQNRYLLELTEHLLERSGFSVYSPEKIPANDGGLALGQLIIAAKRRSFKN